MAEIAYCHPIKVSGIEKILSVVYQHMLVPNFEKNSLCLEESPSEIFAERSLK